MTHAWKTNDKVRCTPLGLQYQINFLIPDIVSPSISALLTLFQSPNYCHQEACAQQFGAKFESEFVRCD